MLNDDEKTRFTLFSSINLSFCRKFTYSLFKNITLGIFLIFIRMLFIKSLNSDLSDKKECPKKIKSNFFCVSFSKSDKFFL